MDIKLEVTPDVFHYTDTVHGTVSVSYPGRYDGIVVNAQVLDSNHHMTYTSYNDTKVSGMVARLFIPRKEITQNTARFEAKAKFEADRDYEVKFRASVIEQHKEVDSHTVFVKCVP